MNKRNMNPTATKVTTDSKYVLTDANGTNRIMTGKMNCPSMVSLLGTLFPNAKGKEIETRLGMKQTTVSQIRGGYRKARLKNDVLSKMIAQAGRKRMPELIPQIYDANGDLPVTGKPDLKRMTELLDEARGSESLEDFAVKCRFGMTDENGNVVVAKPPYKPFVVEEIAANSACGRKVTTHMIQGANFCGNDADETIEDVAESAIEPQVETPIETAVETPESVPAIPATMVSKQVGTAGETIRRVRPTAPVETEVSKKEISDKTVNVMRGLVIVARDLELSETKCDELLGDVEAVANDPLKSKLIETYRSIRLAGAEEGSISLTTGDLKRILKGFATDSLS
jgi:hypothetical protein